MYYLATFYSFIMFVLYLFYLSLFFSGKNLLLYIMWNKKPFFWCLYIYQCWHNHVMHSTNVVAFHSFVQLFIHSNIHTYIHIYIEETLIKTTCVFERITLHAFHKYLTFLLELRRRDILFFWTFPSFSPHTACGSRKKKGLCIIRFSFPVVGKIWVFGFYFFLCFLYNFVL